MIVQPVVEPMDRFTALLITLLCVLKDYVDPSNHFKPRQFSKDFSRIYLMLKRHSMNINSREATHIVEKYVLRNKSANQSSVRSHGILV